MTGTYIAGPKRRIGEPFTIGTAAVAWLTSPAGQATVGGFVQGILNGLGIGGGPSRWENAGAGVHEWFHYHAEQAFQDWMDANHPNAFGSLDSCKGFHYMWTYMGAPDPAQGNRLQIAPRFARQLTDPIWRLPTDAMMNQLWAAMGVDLPASFTRHIQNGYPNTPADLNTLNPNFLVFIPGFGAAVDGRIDEVIDSINNGDDLTDEDLDVAEGLENENIQAKDNTTLLITAGAAAAGLLFR